MTTSTTPLPPLYARWIEQSFGRELPSEDRATCSNCAMCGEAAERDGTTPDLRFNPNTKCCTFHPDLPNFLVGAVLADDTPGLTGKDVVANRIRERIGSTPLGLFASPDFKERHGANQARGADASLFGRATDLLCPYFNPAGGGLCGLWLHRNSSCSTWFCKHRDGALGKRFWDAAAHLLKFTERALASWCVVELVKDEAVLDELFDPMGAPRELASRNLRGKVDADGRLSVALSERVWGSWYGREEAFFRRCHELVGPLDWTAVVEKAGPQLQHLERRMKALLPERYADAQILCKGQFASMPIDANRLRIRGAEASNEPIELPTALVKSLGAFNGRPAADVLKELAARGIEINDELLGALRRRGILLPPDGNDVPPIARPTGPLTPNDELRFFRGYRGAEPLLVEGKSAQGKPTLSISCGQRGITVEDATGFRFVRELVRHANGFRAGDAAAWLGIAPENWDQVRQVLESLVASELLQRVPSGQGR